jgi:phage gpG-like protein
MISVTLAGGDQRAARWAGFSERIRQGLERVMQQIGNDLEARVLDTLCGSVLQRRSGRLAAAQLTIVTSGGGAVAVSVGFDPQLVPYGAIQEFGGTTRAHLIEAKRGVALAFTAGDRLALAKRVQHPGSVLPERSFLRSSLAELAGEGSDEVATSVREALDA